MQNIQDINELINKYPMFFKTLEEPELWPIKFGVECGNGWYGILDKLFQDILSLTETKKIRIPQVHQIKEKFGTLRFYIDSADAEIFDLIEKAEEASEETCEACGQPGKIIKKNGWLMVRCENCLNNK